MRHSRTVADADALLLHLAKRTSDPHLRGLLSEDLARAADDLPDHAQDIHAEIGRITTSPADRPRSPRLLSDIRPSAKRQDVDVVIVTVKRPEFDATLLAFGVDPAGGRDALVAGADVYEFAVETVTGERREIRGVITMNGEDSNYTMAAFCSSIDHAYRARTWILLGMAAGIKGRTKLGHVMCVNKVVDQARILRRPDGDEPNPRDYAVRGPAARQLLHFEPRRHGWHEVFRQRMDEAAAHPVGFKIPAAPRKESWLPGYRVGVSIAGDILIEDDKLGEVAQMLHQRKALGGEMEGLGFASFCNEDPAKTWLMWRGIADYGGPRRVQNWQFTATLAAATACRLMLERHYDLPRRDDAERQF